MEFSMKRVNALFIKELKDLKRNTNVLLMCVLPIMLSLLYKNFFNSVENINEFLPMCFNMNLSMAAAMIMAMLIAEEKEKNTLRTLMLSGVSPIEFLAGKAILTMIICNIINIIIFIAFGINLTYIIQYFIIGLIFSINMIIIGAIVGILSKNQMSSGTVAMPVTMTFFLIPTLASVNKAVKNIANVIPSYHAEKLVMKTIEGESILNGTFHLLVLLIWIVISAAAFAYIYKTKRLDD